MSPPSQQVRTGRSCISFTTLLDLHNSSGSLRVTLQVMKILLSTQKPPDHGSEVYLTLMAVISPSICKRKFNTHLSYPGMYKGLHILPSGGIASLVCQTCGWHPTMSCMPSLFERKKYKNLFATNTSPSKPPQHQLFFSPAPRKTPARVSPEFQPKTAQPKHTKVGPSGANCEEMTTAKAKRPECHDTVGHELHRWGLQKICTNSEGLTVRNGSHSLLN